MIPTKSRIGPRHADDFERRTADLYDANLTWRDRRRLELRASVLNAAEILIRKTGGTEFTMRELAEKSGVAHATPFNLFGSKTAMLYAMVAECVRAIEAKAYARKIKNPIDQIFEVSRVAARFYGDDPVYCRPLLRVLGKTLETELHSGLFLRGMRIWSKAIERAVTEGHLRPNARREVLERQLVINLIGVVHFWVEEELDANGFLNHVLLGTGLAMTVYVPEPEYPGLMKRIVSLEKAVPKSFLDPGPST